MLLKKQLINFLDITESSFDKFVALRQQLMQLEHSYYPDDPGNLKFYTLSDFLIYSHYQDEIERDADTDWEDMVQALKDRGKEAFNDVLDFGCGIGSAGFNLVRRMPVDNLHCHEPNILSSAFCMNRQKIINDGKTTNIMISNTPFDKSYDLIILWGVLEHLPDASAFSIMNKLIDTLAPGGLLFLKNFYSDTEDYRFHFPKGDRMAHLFEVHKDKIVWAKYSD